MLKFRPSNLTQKRANINFNELQLIALIEKGLSDNSLRGLLYKRSSLNAKWRMKWFLLFENLLFYFDLGSSYNREREQQQQQQQQQPPSSSSSGKSPSKTFSSLIRRQNKQQQSGSATKDSAAASEWHQQQNSSEQLKQQRLSNQRASASAASASASTSAAAAAAAASEPRRASASETLEIGSRRLGAGPTNGHEEDLLNCDEQVASGQVGKSAAAATYTQQQQQQRRAPRQRLSSDPQNLWAPAPEANSATSASAADCSLTAGLNNSHHHHRSFSVLGYPGGCCGGGGSGGTCSGGGAGNSRTLNSSSISGVSGHFLAHNEQTIGRSTTTAGKTATSSANYSSLLSRKIGVIFLEGSYCERLVESAANFSGVPQIGSNSSGAAIGQHGATTCSSSSGGGARNCPSNSELGLDGVVVRNFCEQHFGSPGNNHQLTSKNGEEESELDCIFTLKWKKEGSKEYQFRTETEAECQAWVHAISNARYSTLLNDKEQLEQKYLHLSQIIESESTAKWQYSKQCEEFLAEIKKLRQEICALKRQETRSNHLRLVLSKSAAIVDTIMRQQRRRQRQQQQQQQQPQQQRSDQLASSPVVGQQQQPPGRFGGGDIVSEAGEGGDEMKSGGGGGARDATQEANLPAFDSSSSNLAYSQATAPYSTTNTDRVEPQLVGVSQAGTGDTCASSKQERLLARARSMEQEQEEQELAVRRTRRCVGANMRLASVDEQARRSDALKSLVRSASGRGSATCSPQPLSDVAGGPQADTTRPGAFGQQTGGGSGGDGIQATMSMAEDETVDEHALSIELKSVVEALNNGVLLSDCLLEVENSEEIRKIKKVQGFFRGWLCRRRWKQIVQEYIKSPHAESMRKRNNLVFRMVECEEEYVEQLTLLISAFLRPIKMAASSQKPALDHDELNSIFLNSETLLFLHQIFLKGLTARMESWPTLVLGDLFNMLLPMLTIYQEYVRNHHFSLQVLAECKQREQFSLILRRLEEKPQLNGRTLETFLTYPMHQIPRYIICLHEILAHTPHNHVERKSLYEAQTKLEELSRQMHDEVSETENIRQNLAIERMIIGGCDILLDVNQVFVRQGILLQVVGQLPGGKSAKSRSRLTSFASRQPNRQQQQQLTNECTVANQTNSGNSNYYHQTTTTTPTTTNCDNHQTKELIRQCFLFTNHLLLCTRTKDGKLHLLEKIGRISLSEITLIENPLEFIHQQETIIANFESIAQNSQQQQPNRAQQQQQQQQQQQRHNRGKNSSCNSISDYADGATNYGGVNNDKRASTASVPAKWGSAHLGSSNQQGNPAITTTPSKFRNEKRTSHVEFEDHPTVSSVFSSSSAQFSPPAAENLPGLLRSKKQQQPNDHHNSVGSDELASYSGSKIAAQQQPNKQANSGGSSRGRIAGYLVTKLSNLTNLAGGGSGGFGGQQQQTNSLSAPPSPSNKRSGQVPPTTPQTPTNRRPTANSAYPSASNTRNSSLFGDPSLFHLYKDYGGCDFILLLESTSKSGAHLSNVSSGGTTSSSSSAAAQNHSSNLSGGHSTLIIHLVAPNLQEKAAWMSDISQCIDNVHFNDLFHGSVTDSSSVTINQSVRTDPRLYKDDVDIKFSRALNSCKLPQIRYASKERLFERLTDLRFLSIDFLNTFLLTYRVFTTAEDVLEALKSVHYNCDRYYQQQQQHQQQQQQQLGQQMARDSFCAFANSSLNSLNNNNNSNTSTFNQTDHGLVQEDHQCEQHKPDALSKSPTTTICSDKNRGELLLQTATAPTSSSLSSVVQSSDQQKPIIPPRSSNTDLSAKLNAQIEGSNSSSLANLACAYKSATTTNTNSSTSQSSQQQQHLLAPNLTTTSSNPSETDELTLRLSEDEEKDEEKEADKPPPFVGDRLRSSSMTPTRQLLVASGSKTNLDVPNSRQVRASSFSHVPNINLMSATKRSEIRTSPASGGGGGHWRLSYKKMSGVGTTSGGGQMANGHDQSRQDHHYLLTAGANKSTLSTARRASSSDVNVTFHVTLDPPPIEAANTSSNSRVSDDEITIHSNQSFCPIVPPSTPVIGEPPDNDIIDDNNLEEVNITKTDCDTMKLSSSGKNLITRPTSSSSTKKVVLVEGVEKKQSCSSSPGFSNDLVCHNKPSDVIGEIIIQKVDDGSTSDGSSLVASASSSSLSSGPPTTNSVLTSQSESSLIQSTSSLDSSDADADADGGHHLVYPSSSTSRHVNGLQVPASRRRRSKKRGHNKSMKRRSKSKSLADQMSTGDKKQPAAVKGQVRKVGERLRARSFIIKEIELTEAKILDCDTSADEDKVSTSSGGDNDDDDEDNDHKGGAVGGDDTDSDDQELSGLDNGNDDEDDRSFQILTRLNSVKLTNNKTTNNDSEHEDLTCCSGSDIESAALIKLPNSDGKNHHIQKVSSYDRKLETKKALQSPTTTSTTNTQQEITKNGAQQVVDKVVAAVKVVLDPLKTACDEKDTKIKPAAADIKPPSSPNTTRGVSTSAQVQVDAAQSLHNQPESAQHAKELPNPPVSSSAETPSKSPQQFASPTKTPENGGTNQRPWTSSSTHGLQSTGASSRMTTPRSSFQHHASEAVSSGEIISKAGVIITSSSPRVSTRRSSTASAASAFAAATAASNNPLLTQPPPLMKQAHFAHQQPINRHQFESAATATATNQLIDSMHCLCSNILLHRGSISSQIISQQQQQRFHSRAAQNDLANHRVVSTMNLPQNYYHHNPSCVYFQGGGSLSNTPSNSYPNPPSDTSSLCNSRASSRLSSCAGLEYSSYSSAQVNFYAMNQHQQFIAMSNQMAATNNMPNVNNNSKPGSFQSSPIQAPQFRGANQQNNVTQPMAACGRSGPNRSKRNSTQINIRSVATIRVLSVLRHWVSKHSQDFVNDTKLSYLVQEFLQDLIIDTNLLPAEHKAALQLQQMVQKAAHSRGTHVDLDVLLATPTRPSPDSIETLSALEIAEGMTYLDHKIFLAIRSEEFLGQAWMKMDKAIKAPHILLITKRFNDVSRLVSSEIIRVPELHRRVAIIEKWTNVAHICRVVHNFNGVLQICAAFTNSAVFRLKKTWDKIPKTTKTTIDQLQNLVSTDSRFRNMRDAINRCDPPSIPYVGMYLTDLSFIEEGTPNYSPDGLLNFSKMRMIAHVIREIQHLQNGSYKIELNHKVANYLLDASRHLQDDEMYRCSLAIEPRSSGGKNGVQILNSVSSQYNGTTSNNQQNTNPPQSHSRHNQKQA